jgi:hypothetical protein
MPDMNAVSVLFELPNDATNAQALDWVHKMRRLIDRWETLPEYASRSMTPELKQQANGELDELEHSIRRNMALPQGA